MIVFLLVLLFSSVGWASNQPNTSFLRDKSAVLIENLNRGSSTTIISDLSCQNNVAISSAGVSYIRTRNGWAVDFNGLNNGWKVFNPGNFNMDKSTAFSVGYVMENATSSIPSSDESIVAKRANDVPQSGWEVVHSNSFLSGMRFGMVLRTGPQVSARNLCAMSDVLVGDYYDGGIHLIMWSYDGNNTNGSFKLSIDGESKNVTSQCDSALIENWGNATQVTVGNRDSGSNFYGGNLKNVFIFNNKAITRGEASQIWNTIQGRGTDDE